MNNLIIFLEKGRDRDITYGLVKIILIHCIKKAAAAQKSGILLTKLYINPYFNQ